MLGLLLRQELEARLSPLGGILKRPAAKATEVEEEDLGGKRASEVFEPGGGFRSQRSPPVPLEGGAARGGLGLHLQGGKYQGGRHCEGS